MLVTAVAGNTTTELEAKLARVELELADVQRVANAVHRAGMALTADLELERIVQTLTDEATALCRADFGSFFYNVVGERGEAFMLYTLCGAPKEAFARFPMPRATPIFATTFNGEGILRSGDIRKDPRYGVMGAQPAGHLPVVSYLAVPVTSRTGEVLGGLFFGHKDASVFTERDEGAIAIMASQAALHQLVDDLLDVSRAISGKMRIEVQPLDLGAVIRSAIDAVRPAADAKQICITTELDAGSSSMLGDAGRIRQVIWNLLNNAVKFTARSGAVFVGLSHSESNIELVVSDGERKGAKFVLRFPLVDGRSAVPAVSEPRPSRRSQFHVPSNLRGLRVLVVDDERDATELVAELLGSYGVTTYTASSAEQAMDVLERERPDALVSDIGMPGEDGYSLIGRIRKLPDPSLSALPAMALTAFARKEDRAKALGSGFDHHLAKPVEPNELFAVLGSMIATRRRPA